MFGWRALTDRGRALVAAGVTLAASGLALGFVDLTRIGVLALLLPFLSAWTLRATAPRLDVRRSATPLTPEVGVETTISLDVNNTSRSFSLATPAEETLPVELGSRRHLVIHRIPPGGSTQLRYSVRPTRRGAHRLGPFVLRHRDPFGLAAVAATVPATTDLLVLPPVHPLPAIRLGGEGAGSSGASSQLHGSTEIDDATLRGYRVGDDLRHVHWPVTAHRGQLMVRHEGRPTLRRAVLVIDTDLAGPSGSGGQSAPQSAAVDWAVEALASVAAHLATADYALHVVTPAAFLAGEVASEAISVDRVLRELATAEPTPSRSTRTSHFTSPDASIETPLLAWSRDLAAGGGVLVVVVGDRNPELARSLFGIRPASVTGLGFVLRSATFDGGPPPSTSADDLAALASAGGWKTTVVDRLTPVDAAWNALATSDSGGPA